MFMVGALSAVAHHKFGHQDTNPELRFTVPKDCGAIKDKIILLRLQLDILKQNPSRVGPSQDEWMTHQEIVFLRRVAYYHCRQL